MHLKGFRSIFLHGIILAFLFEVCSCDDDFRCPYNIHVNKGQIIEAKASVDNGASFLKHYEVRDARECYKLCCERRNCDLAQMQYKNYTDGFFSELQKVCFMFHCGKPSKCLFGQHDHYATISYDRPSEELSYIDGNQFGPSSVKTGEAKLGTAKEIKPSVREGNTKDRVQGSSQYKPPSRQYTTEEQDKYEEEEDLRSSWKQKSYEGSTVHSKQPFGKDRYHSKNTHESLSAKKLSRPVLDKDEYSENSQESQKPYYQVTSNHPDFPTKHQHVNIKGPVRPGNPVKEVAKEPTEEKATTHDSDDVDRELERKLEELMPKTDTQQYQPSGGDTKAVPTTVKPTFHQWRQFVDNNPNFPYTIPSKVEHPLEQAVEKQTEKPVEKPVQKKPVEIPAQKQVDLPVQKPVEVPVQKPVQVPEQRPVQVPVQRPVEETVQKVPVQKKPIEVPVQKKPVEVPLLKPVEKPIQTQVPKPWQEPTEPETEPPKPTEPIIMTEKARVHDEPKQQQDVRPLIEVPIQSKNISDVVVIETHRLKIIENKAVLPLAIFLVIAILLLFVVALRLRIVKSRLKRRPFATDDADYLINGMYL